jgi:hypothetical protein
MSVSVDCQVVGGVGLALSCDSSRILVKRGAISAIGGGLGSIGVDMSIIEGD